MSDSYKQYLHNAFFSHIYVERGILRHPLTVRILDKFPRSAVIEIEHYKDIFNRSNQNFDAQKQSIKLILAAKRAPFFYAGSEMCENSVSGEGSRFLYAAQMMNCPYNCEYCYLRGMYESGNIVAFVNTEDYFSAIPPDDKIFLSVSYETDLLALERIFNFAESWINFVRRSKNITLELRTKSAAFGAISHVEPARNVILSWTLSPDEIIKKFEHNAPGLSSRLSAMRAAMEAGWNVRMCLDPVLLTGGWKNDLLCLFEQIRDTIDISKLYDIIAGGFRVSKTYYRRMRKLNPASVIFTLPLAESGGVMRYPPEDERELQSYVKGLIGK